MRACQRLNVFCVDLLEVVYGGGSQPNAQLRGTTAGELIGMQLDPEPMLDCRPPDPFGS